MDLGASGAPMRWTLRALSAAAKVGLETQVNTTVGRHNVNHLPEITQIVAQAGSRLWSVFFLIVTGRAQLEDDLTAEEYEQVFALLYRTALVAPFDIKTTEAPHYRRYCAQEKKRTGRERAIARHFAHPAALRNQRWKGSSIFVSHTGEIFPSGFLELSAGNVRTRTLADAYRNSQLFQVIRKPENYEGKCGVCEYRSLCGGSRSRALALTGNHLGSDPGCVYQPALRSIRHTQR